VSHSYVMLERIQNGLSLAIAGGGLMLAAVVAPSGWWTWPLMGLGLLGLLVGLPVQVVGWAHGRDVQRAPKLDEKTLEIIPIDRLLPAIGNRAPGRALGLRFVDRSKRGIQRCRLRVEHLECWPDPGWNPDLQRRPLLLWDDGQAEQDVPPAGQRTCWIVSATLDLPDDPRGHLGPAWTIVQGRWRVSLVIEAAGYQVRKMDVCFELRKPLQSEQPENLLRWETTGI
jgi:hypothetical protein